MKRPLIFLLFILLTTSQTVFAQGEEFLSGINGMMNTFSLKELGIRFSINFVAIYILVRWIYFTKHRNTDFLFTLILFNCVNFLICFLLSGANLEVGFAFGLFAIFSIMRYRTVTLPVKEMGFLFLSVAMGLLNALASPQDDYLILIGSNLFIIVLAFSLDRVTSIGHNLTKELVYERIDLIKPEKREEMIEDLRERTGLPVQSVEILTINLMRDTAKIKIRY